MGHRHDEKFPRGALIGAAGLVGLSLVAAATARTIERMPVGYEPKKTQAPRATTTTSESSPCAWMRV